MFLRHLSRRSGWFARRLRSSVAMLTAFALILAQIQVAAADIANDAVATATYATGTVTSTVSSQSVPVISAAPAISVSKSGSLNDDDGTPGLSAGDTISYAVTVSNTGNISLTGISLSDPLINLSLGGGDDDSDGEVDPGETWTYTGSYIITQNDIDTDGGGDGDIDNTVTVNTNELADELASTEVALPNSDIMISKSGVLNDDDGKPGLSAGDSIDYQVTLTNSGTTDQTTVTVTDILEQNGNSQTLPLSGPSGDANSDNVLNPGEVWQFTTVYIVTQANLDDGNDLVNRATVTSDQMPVRGTTDTQPLAGLQAAYTMTKSAVLVDGDGDNLGDAGETINYTFAFTNTGNVTLTNLAANDPLPDLSALVCSFDAEPDQDIDTLAPGASANCTASYVIKQTDVDAGALTNTATASATMPDGSTSVAEDNSANDNSTTTSMDRVTALEIKKTSSTPVFVMTGIYDYQYTLTITNAGSIQQTGIRVEDDLTGVPNAPAQWVGTPSTAISGFSGAGGLNSSYDGAGDTELLAGDVQLAPGESGTITIQVRVDTGGEPYSGNNVAFANSNEVTTPVHSDDPTVTPDEPNDTSATPVSVPDADEDGSPDKKESKWTDRDDDGISDAEDYDPTGYLYCEDDGRVLAGGLISVTNLTSGGTQTGIGTSNSITIVEDGSTGYYQFYVSAPGTYRLVPTLPPGALASTTRISGGTLDVTSLLPANPGVLGAGEIGATGILNDFSAAANPFYTDFEIEAGDPSIFNNNLPIRLCGVPEITATKEVANGPNVLADARSEITFRLIAENTGNQAVDNVQITDDLATVFGAGNFVLGSATVESAPAGFTATIDPFFDGDGNQALLTAGGTLQAGERVSILVPVTVDVPDGTYTNAIIASGDDSRNASALPASSANMDVDINGLANVEGLYVSKTTPVASVRLGAAVPFNLEFSNSSASGVAGAEFVDFMPAGFTYLQGSARLNGVATEPLINGRELVWPNQTLASGATSTLTLSMILGAAASGSKFTNSAFMRNPLDGSTVSNVAKAIVKLEIEPVFQCSDIVGRVYDDKNGDGYYDDGEPGLAGVRIATVNGLLITTDQFGRYHVACDQIPRDRIGSNYILKLDTRTLPTGYRVTSENPRVVRVTRGKLAKINFGAIGKRIVRLEITDTSFVSNQTSLTREALSDIAGVLPILEEAPSILELTYRTSNERSQLQRFRLRSVRALIEQAWNARDRNQRLEIETQLQ